MTSYDVLWAVNGLNVCPLLPLLLLPVGKGDSDVMQAAAFCYRLAEDLYQPFRCQQTVLLTQLPPVITRFPEKAEQTKISA